MHQLVRATLVGFAAAMLSVAAAAAMADDPPADGSAAFPVGICLAETVAVGPGVADLPLWRLVEALGVEVARGRPRHDPIQCDDGERFAPARGRTPRPTHDDGGIRP
jgi:hypothetical protein